MKRETKLVLFAVVFVAIVALLIFTPTSASDGLPEGVYVFEAGDHTCVVAGDNLECFCPCEGCGVRPIPPPDPTPDPTPDPEEPKTTYICHVPPGNPNNPQNIGCKSQGCIDAHLKNHEGDYLGKCK